MGYTKRSKAGDGPKVDGYQAVTDRILKALDEGTIPWQRPWNVVKGGGPTRWNGEPYLGINPFLLMLTAMERGYTSPYWLTFNEIERSGGHLKPGQNKANGQGATAVILFKKLIVEDRNKRDKNGDPVQKQIPLIRLWNVFNLDQTEDVKLPKVLRDQIEAREAAAVNHDPIKAAEDILANVPNPPKFVHADLAGCWYQPSTDTVNVPLMGQFHHAADYYSAAFHEYIHATGHESRLKRDLTTSMDKESYSREELVASFGQAFLLGAAGIDAKDAEFDNIAGYIDGWRKALTDDPKALVWAAGRAQKAADYILGNLAETENREDAQEGVLQEAA